MGRCSLQHHSGENKRLRDLWVNLRPLNGALLSCWFLSGVETARLLQALGELHWGAQEGTNPVQGVLQTQHEQNRHSWEADKEPVPSLPFSPTVSSVLLFSIACQGARGKRIVLCRVPAPAASNRSGALS